MHTRRNLIILNYDISQAFDRCSRLMVQEITKILWICSSRNNSHHHSVFEKLSIIMLRHKRWISAWQSDCTCINSILFLPNSVSPIDIHVLEQKAMKGKGFQWLSMTFIKNCDIIMLGHLSLTKKKKSCLLKVRRVIVAIKPGYSRNMSQLLI